MIFLIFLNESSTRDHDLMSIRVLFVSSSFLRLNVNLISVRSESNIKFSSRFLFSEIIFLMHLNRVFKSLSSTLKRRRLFERLRNNVLSVMRACKNCFFRSQKCRVKNGFDRCVKCVRLRRKCDLVISDAE